MLDPDAAKVGDLTWPGGAIDWRAGRLRLLAGWRAGAQLRDDELEAVVLAAVEAVLELEPPTAWVRSAGVRVRRDTIDVPVVSGVLADGPAAAWRCRWGFEGGGVEVEVLARAARGPLSRIRTAFENQDRFPSAIPQRFPAAARRRPRSTPSTHM